MTNITYRDAQPEDAALILEFILSLARYEKLEHEVSAKLANVEKTLFGPDSKAFCIIAEKNDVACGFCLCFYNYSTFQGKPGIYIEDLYVDPTHRGQGIGKGFFKILAQKALDEDCGRIQWWVLDWNKPSIEFYKSMGAKAMDEWTVFRLEPDAIESLAKP